MALITQARLKELLNYDPETGVFTWRVRRGSQSPGNVAGTPIKGYIKILIDGKQLASHRLAFLYVFGSMPTDEVDHINGDKADNRIANLRLATRSQNMANQKSNIRSRSGLKGAIWRSDNRTWRGKIKVNGRNIWLGSFETAEDAHAAYCKAAREIFGEFARFE